MHGRTASAAFDANDPYRPSRCEFCYGAVDHHQVHPEHRTVDVGVGIELGSKQGAKLIFVHGLIGTGLDKIAT